MARAFNAKRLVILCTAIMLVLLSAWVAGFVFFTKSSTWSEAKLLILTNKQYPVASGSEVSPELKGFSYRFSGNYEAFRLNVHIKSPTVDRHFHVMFERTNGSLRLVRMTPD